MTTNRICLSALSKLALNAGELRGFLDESHQNQQKTKPASGAEVLEQFRLFQDNN